jgi:uncharacterized protein (TIGR03663 family)
MIEAAKTADVSAPGYQTVGDQVRQWGGRLAAVDWRPWSIVVLAALLRLFLLGIKPPHFDEGINGWFVDQMMKTGYYRYDPTNYHGPLHFYVLFLSQILFGRNLWALRMPVVIMSTVCVWFMLKFEPLIGRNVSRWAALAMAVSPGFVFYGRYSIHEVWLVFFSMLFVYGLLGLRRFGTSGALWACGMGISGMILTKETYIIHFTCAAIAGLLCWVSNIIAPVDDGPVARRKWDAIDLASVIATSVVLIVFFYSGTFFHWSGVKGIGLAYTAWFETGTNGHGHEKPWDYWLCLIGRYEIAVIFGLATSVFWLRLRNTSLRFLAIYGIGTIMAYSIVKYKTPWCIVSLVWPILALFGAARNLVPLRLKFGEWVGAISIVTAGVAVSIVFARTQDYQFIWPFLLVSAFGLYLLVLRDAKILFAVQGAVLAASLGWAICLNYFRCTTFSEPYVYVQTYNDIFKLTRPVLALARRDPALYEMTGHLVRTSSYPLPWILGDFPRVGYYEHDALPEKMDADFLLVQEDRITEVEKKLHNSYYTEPLTIRPYQDTSKVYFEAQRFKDFFPGRVPDFTGKGPAN